MLRNTCSFRTTYIYTYRLWSTHYFNKCSISVSRNYLRDTSFWFVNDGTKSHFYLYQLMFAPTGCIPVHHQNVYPQWPGQVRSLPPWLDVFFLAPVRGKIKQRNPEKAGPLFGLNSLKQAAQREERLSSFLHIVQVPPITRFKDRKRIWLHLIESDWCLQNLLKSSKHH